ncbi:MAG: GH36 C-terminal domain-containing protein [Microthrixaceae bacterium]
MALWGRFGFDIDLNALDESELEVCRRATALAHRAAAVVQKGDPEHLVSPVEGDDRSRAAVAYHAGDAGSVVFAYQLEDPSGDAPRIRPRALERAASYRLTATDLRSDEPLEVLTLSGEELAARGLDWPLSEACTARIWEVERLA